MKKLITLTLLSAILFSCNKKKTLAPATQPVNTITTQENYGPYGKLSNWKCIGGDSIFTEILSLTYFYTEKHQPCNICYYQQSYSLYNDFTYTLWVSECIT